MLTYMVCVTDVIRNRDLNDLSRTAVESKSNPSCDCITVNVIYDVIQNYNK